MARVGMGGRQHCRPLPIPEDPFLNQRHALPLCNVWPDLVVNQT